MSNSTHKVEVFKIEEIFPHLNADSLEILRPFGGYQCVVKKGEWKVGDLAAYVPPDSLVPLDHPTFSWLSETGRSPKFLNGKAFHRVTAVKLRKEPSLGLVVSVPESSKEGDDLAHTFGVLHYDPPEKHSGQTTSTAKPWWMRSFKPNLPVPVYDLEALRRFSEVFTPGEPVIVTEKIHGSNCRLIWDSSKKLVIARDGLRLGRLGIRWGGQGRRGVSLLPADETYLWVGSRTQWRIKGDNWYWDAVKRYPQIVEFLKAYPGWSLYGEVFGEGVQDLTYGQKEVDFRAFDVRMLSGQYVNWLTAEPMLQEFGVPMVPRLSDPLLKFNLDHILSLAEGSSMLPNANHIREGVVVRPEYERVDPRVGRVVLKAVGAGYLERQK